MGKLVPLWRRSDPRNPSTDNIVHYATVDDEDYARVTNYTLKWRLRSDGYAYTKKMIDGQQKTVLMHRFVLGIYDSNVHVDHWNHDKLHNSKFNLKPGTQAENNMNTSVFPRSDSSSKHKGVGKYRGKWRAQGWENGKTVWLGAFLTEDDAKAKYDEWKSNV